MAAYKSFCLSQRWQLQLFKSGGLRDIEGYWIILILVVLSTKKENIYVVVNFLSQVIFVFLLFLGMVMYANEVETKEKQKLPEIKN